MRRDDWLAHQLPVGMTDDDFLMRFLKIFQTVSDTVLHQIDTLPHMFDASVAPSPMVRQMSRWLGLELVDSSLEDALQRQIVMEYSKLLKWRGTRRGMQHMLEIVTAGEVTVTDNGGVYPEGESPRSAPHVVIEVEGTGWATEEDLLVMVRTELPASVTFELRIDHERVWPVDGPARENLAVRTGAVTPETVSVGATMSAASIGDVVGPGSMGPGVTEVSDGDDSDEIGTDARPEDHSDHRPDRLRDLDAPEHGPESDRNADGTDQGGNR